MTDILSANYFEIFEVPVSYNVDLEQVQHRYRELQKAVHPDKFANASSQERRLSMQHTSLINQAFNALKDPVERAVYLLQLKGQDFTMDNETTMDASFLMEQMEMREALEYVHSKQDPLDELDTMLKQVNARQAALMNDFEQAYEADDLDAAREAVRKLQFMMKAKKEINDLAASIEDEIF
jgi:molecular chaperone HscB